MSVPNGIPVAGRPLPDEEIEEIAESNVTTLGSATAARLRQRTMYEYTTHAVGSNLPNRAKSKSDFVVDKFAAIPWGDPVASGKKKNRGNRYFPAYLT
jgi:hypothetical protein